MSLYNSRTIALEAKSSIDIVSATLRTIGTLKQMFSTSEYDEYPLSFQTTYFDEKQQKDKKFTSNKTLSEIKSYFKNINQIDSNTAFDELAASILQTTLDFGNSGKTEFNKDWYVPLLRAA